MNTTKLRDIAHARTGDKGDVSNISIVAFHIDDYARLAELLTVERVTAHFAELMLYEVHDPAAYLTPDVSADFTHAGFESIARDEVRVQGAGGHARPETLKVSVGFLDGWIGEGQMSYGGPGALARGLLAKDIVLKRLALTGVACEDIQAELIGVSALHGSHLGARAEGEPWEVRLRVAARCVDKSDADRRTDLCLHLRVFPGTARRATPRPGPRQS